MLKAFAVLLALATLACAQDDLSLKGLTQKNLERQIAKALTPGSLNNIAEALPQLQILTLDPSTHQCAVPLKEMRVSNRIDPMAFKTSGAIKNFDRIAHPAPIQACSKPEGH